MYYITYDTQLLKKLQFFLYTNFTPLSHLRIFVPIDPPWIKKKNGQSDRFLHAVEIKNADFIKIYFRALLKKQLSAPSLNWCRMIPKSQSKWKFQNGIEVLEHHEYYISLLSMPSIIRCLETVNREKSWN